jgi:gliding motility-associated-like protein
VLCSKETIFIPTGFTPNGDGLNDRFGVLGGGVTTIGYFRITDRWGKTVFERNNVPFGSTSSFWDGNYPNGLPAASGSYIYAVEVTCSTGTAFRYSGSVTLLR